MSHRTLKLTNWEDRFPARNRVSSHDLDLRQRSHLGLINSFNSQGEWHKGLRQRSQVTLSLYHKSGISPTEPSA